MRCQGTTGAAADDWKREQQQQLSFAIGCLKWWVSGEVMMVARAVSRQTEGVVGGGGGRGVEGVWRRERVGGGRKRPRAVAACCSCFRTTAASTIAKLLSIWPEAHLLLSTREFSVYLDFPCSHNKGSVSPLLLLSAFRFSLAPPPPPFLCRLFLFSFAKPLPLALNNPQSSSSPTSNPVGSYFTFCNS